MEEQNNTAGFYTQKTANINNFGVWLYLIDSPIGNIFIVEWEDEGHGLNRKIYDGDLESAERKFKAICRKMVG